MPCFINFHTNLETDICLYLKVYRWQRGAKFIVFIYQGVNLGSDIHTFPKIKRQLQHERGQYDYKFS